MAFYSKTHTNKKAAANHVKKLRKRSAKIQIRHKTSYGNSNDKIIVDYYFPKKKK